MTVHHSQPDIVERLRRHERDYQELVHGPLCGLAADRIEELTKALEQIAYLGKPTVYTVTNLVVIARAALEERK